MLRLHPHLFPSPLEKDNLPTARTLEPAERRAAEKPDSALLKRLFQGAGHIRIHFPQNVWPPLQHRHSGAQTGVITRKLKRDRPAAQHHHRIGDVRRIQNAITVPAANFRQTRNLHAIQPGTRGDQERAAMNPKRRPVVLKHLQVMRIHKPSHAPEVPKSPGLKLAAPVLGEI